MEANTEVNAKLIAKIQKIMAMADPKNGASEGEVANATLLMNRLLQDNGLSLAQVQSSGEKADTAREKSLTERRAHFKWQKELMSMLAAVNFCWHTVDKVKHRDEGQKKGLDGEHPWRTSSLHILVGRPINITVTIQMYDYLSRAVTREAVKRDYEHGTKDNNQFFEGAVSKLAERLRDQKEKREREDREKRKAEKAAQASAGKGTGTSLVILEEVYSTEEDYNEDFRNGLKPGTTAERRKKQQVETQSFDRRRADFEASGIEWVTAWYMAHGYSNEDAEKRSKEYHRNQERESKKAYNQYAKKGSAFFDGREAANSIGLDAQVGQDKNRIK